MQPSHCTFIHTTFHTTIHGATSSGSVRRTVASRNRMGAGASTSSSSVPLPPQEAMDAYHGWTKKALEALSTADTNGDGRLQVSELAEALQSYGHSYAERKAKGLCIAFGTEFSGEALSKKEFVAAVSELNTFVQQLATSKPKEQKGDPAAASNGAASPAAPASLLDAGIFEEMNLARTKPAEYAAFIEPRLAYFDGNAYLAPGQKIKLLTQEGASAVSELVAFLKKQGALAPYTSVSAGMSRAALEHVLDCGPLGLLGHDGSDGSTPFDRLSRHGKWEESAGENINYGATEARDVVIQLLIDDGVPSRGHRNNIFSKDFTVVGVASGQHTQFGTMQCITFAGRFHEKGSPGYKSASAPALTPRLGPPPTAPGGAQIVVPPGGKKAVSIQVSISDGKKTTTTTTTVTDASGGTQTFVESMVDSA